MPILKGWCPAVLSTGKVSPGDPLEKEARSTNTLVVCSSGCITEQEVEIIPSTLPEGKQMCSPKVRYSTLETRLREFGCSGRAPLAPLPCKPVSSTVRTVLRRLQKMAKSLPKPA